MVLYNSSDAITVEMNFRIKGISYVIFLFDANSVSKYSHWVSFQLAGSETYILASFHFSELPRFRYFDNFMIFNTK